MSKYKVLGASIIRMVTMVLGIYLNFVYLDSQGYKDTHPESLM